MNRAEFMKELERLLVHVPEEERMEAINYYNDYFEDAGIENEATVLAELGSPEKVAKSIQLDIANNDLGEFTERGYQTGDETNPYEVMKSMDEKEKAQKNSEQENQETNQEPLYNQGQNSQGQYNQNQSQNSQGQYNQAQYNQNQNSQSQNSQSQYNQGQNNQAQNNQAQYNQSHYNQGQYNQNQYNNAYGKSHDRNYEPVRKKGLNPLAIILLCIFAIPVGIPIICALFGVFVGIGAAIMGLVFGFGAAALACILSGLVAFVTGVTKLFIFPFVGVLFIGVGLIVFGIGLLFVLLTSLVARLIPVLCRAFVSLCKAPFRRGSVMA